MADQGVPLLPSCSDSTKRHPSSECHDAGLGFARSASDPIFVGEVRGSFWQHILPWEHVCVPDKRREEKYCLPAQGLGSGWDHVGLEASLGFTRCSKQPARPWAAPASLQGLSLRGARHRRSLGAHCRWSDGPPLYLP